MSWWLVLSFRPTVEFLNRDGVEYTVRIDTRVAEESSTGVARSNESRRLRFVLATIGRTAWPGGAAPEEYLDLVAKLNRKAIEEGRPAIDAAIPPGRDVRCIVSVAMLTEGWDATTVTHIIGLRPFESQLLCEQVIGRGLRRAQYHDLSVEEVAKVYGVPFELIPLKATPGTPTPPPKVHHVYALPDRSHLEIRFPRVEGYVHRVSAAVTVAWDRVPVFSMDPLEIPDEVKVKALAGDQGRPSLLGPGAEDDVTLAAWRRGRRIQELAFDMARVLALRYLQTVPPEVPAHALFPQMLAVVQQFVTDRVQPEGRRETIDVFLDPYFTWAVDALLDAIVPADPDVVELPRYEANRQPGSTRDVDFWTSRPVREVQRSPLNYLVMDTQQWEQSAAFYLDTDAHVLAFVKNANLGFAIPYAYRGRDAGVHSGLPGQADERRQGSRHPHPRDERTRSRCRGEGRRRAPMGRRRQRRGLAWPLGVPHRDVAH